jgi:hypothetical protein
MPYYLYLCDQKISGPFSEKSEAWTSASERGLIAVIPRGRTPRADLSN